MARKRRRLAPSSDRSCRHRADASNCAKVSRMSTLPFELLTLIVELACCSEDEAFPKLGRKMLCDLSVTSLDFYHVTRPIVFKRISVSKPSSLYTLWRLITRRPGLGELIRELHIGPQHIVPSFWWPLRAGDLSWDGDCDNWLATRMEVGEGPAGFPYYRSWNLCARPKTCMDAAIAKALAVAQDHLRPCVDLKTQYPHGQAILQRVFEIQAVLELYLIELRRLEDLDPARKDVVWRGACATRACYSGRCKRYPPLVIDDGTRRSLRRPAPKNALVLTRTQLHQHPFRRGGSADDFEHPLLYARSGVPVSYNCSEISTRKEGHVGYASCLIGTDKWEENGANDLDAFVRGGCQQDNAQPIDESDSVPITTLKSTLGWARSILSCATNVQSLSLTGYLGQITCSGLDLSSVSRLSIGPAPSFLPDQFELSGLLNVKELHLCAASISSKDVERLAATPLLERMTWTSPIRHDVASASDMVATIGKLIGRQTSTGGNDFSRDRKSSAEADETVRSASRSGPLPLIEVRMDRSNIDWLLATAPTADVRNACFTGTPLPDARRRLLLVKSEDTVDREDVVDDCGRRQICRSVWLSHYLKAKAWWEGERPGASV